MEDSQPNRGDDSFSEMGQPISGQFAASLGGSPAATAAAAAAAANLQASFAAFQTGQLTLGQVIQHHLPFTMRILFNSFTFMINY